MARVKRLIGSVAALAASVIVLAACAASPGGDTDMDKAAVAAAIEDLTGVVSADVGAFNTGTPGSFGLRVGITVDERGRDELGTVVDGAVRAVASDPGEYESVTVEVTAPDPADPADLVVLTLSRYRDRIPFEEGEYLGSTLTLTAAEVAAVASR